MARKAAWRQIAAVAVLASGLQLPSTTVASELENPEAMIDVAGAVMSEEALADQRGREGLTLQFTDAELGAAVANNIADSNATGANSISHDAFTDSSGLTSVIQNTGNNVVIQSSTIVNVNLNY